MKRLLVAALFLNAALLFLLWREFSALAQDDGGRIATQNGDVNGDTALDVSDAVYLLVHLFRGGPEPVAFAQSDLEMRVTALEEIVGSCLSLPDVNGNGVPDCSESFCGDGRCDFSEDGESCPADCPVDADQDGFATPEDCDDTRPDINPAAQEVCDLLDNDCNLVVDDIVSFCAPCIGGVLVPVDCDDANPCTDDVCDEATGACVHIPLDGAPCEGNGICVGGVCEPQ